MIKEQKEIRDDAMKLITQMYPIKKVTEKQKIDIRVRLRQKIMSDRAFKVFSGLPMKKTMN